MSLASIASYWDIQDLHAGSLSYPLTPAINAVYPTCTASGKVFDDYAANYWIAGVMCSQMNASDQAKFKALMTAYTAVQGVISGDNMQEKRDWFFAGLNSNPASPSEPTSFEEIWPGKAYTHKMQWHIGSMTGSD